MALTRLDRALRVLSKSFSPVAKWVALIGIIVGLTIGKPAIAYSFLGLLLAPAVIGSREHEPSE
jgi:hypothetical protein